MAFCSYALDMTTTRTTPTCRSPRNAVARATASLTSSPVRAPHSGYHFDGRSGRFFEGWYFKVNLPERGKSFALIYSVEDPQEKTQNTGIAAQVMGPDDSYLLQYSRDTRPFWASQSELLLGACFKAPPGINNTRLADRLSKDPAQLQTASGFDSMVEHGYVASQRWHRGKVALLLSMPLLALLCSAGSITAAHGDARGQPESSVSGASWDFSVEPQSGWGSQGDKQKATAGWLAALPVFEPHWQVLMAKGLASGWIQWGEERYEFKSAPAYSEKNWGAGFPKKWFWIQCEDFDNAPDVALTAVGAKRGVKALPGVEEDVGMIGLHWGGTFLELVPWNGHVNWQVEPWGSWRIQASNEQYRAEVEATCSQPGSMLRAPTPSSGLQPACRDSFFGEVRVRVWKGQEAEPSLDVRSSSAAVEVGGGPWQAAWKAEADMKQPLRSLLALNVDVEGISRNLGVQIKGL